LACRPYLGGDGSRLCPVSGPGSNLRPVTRTNSTSNCSSAVLWCVTVPHRGAPCVAPRASWHAHTRLSSPSCLWSSASRTGTLFTRRPRGRAQHATRQGWHTCTHSACLQISSTWPRPHLTTSGHRSGRHHAERTISHLTVFYTHPSRI
jgi:hypothetical protein